MAKSETILHGTCLQVDGHGVLILGPPGSGKSSLALHMIDQAGYGLSSKAMRSVLVADDQVVVVRRGKRLVARSPTNLKGKLEIRGLGIVEARIKASATLALVVKLHDHTHIERMPDAATYEILGISLPLVEIDPGANSATARLRAAVNWIVSLS